MYVSWIHLEIASYFRRDYRYNEATLKKNLFPVQRVAEIMPTRAAANSFFCPLFLFIFGRKNTEVFEKKKKSKLKKKVLTRHIYNHLGVPPETFFFLRVALLVLDYPSNSSLLLLHL